MSADVRDRAITLDRVSVDVTRVAPRDPRRGRRVQTVLDDVTLWIAEGECVGVVGDRLSGASALVRVAGRIVAPASGSVSTGDRSRGSLTVQTVLRRAEEGIDPGSTVEQQVGWLSAGLTGSEAMERRSRVLDVLVTVGLDPEAVDRTVRSLPLVEQRRVLLARAATAAPDVLVLEDLTVGLGPIERGQLLDVVGDLHRDLVPTLLVTDADVAFVVCVSDRLGVLHQGRLVELGPTLQLAGAPAHPYTAALFAALPVPRPGGLAADRPRPRVVLPPSVPVSSCRFHPSCWLADERCRNERPPLEPAPAREAEHDVACFHPLT